MVNIILIFKKLFWVSSKWQENGEQRFFLQVEKFKPFQVYRAMFYGYGKTCIMFFLITNELICPLVGNTDFPLKKTFWAQYSLKKKDYS